MAEHGYEESNALQRERKAARRATILHLVDLKRAGHSPRRTELNIPGDGPLRRLIGFDYRSMDSCAARCADLGAS